MNLITTSSKQVCKSISPVHRNSIASDTKQPVEDIKLKVLSGCSVRTAVCIWPVTSSCD